MLSYSHGYGLGPKVRAGRRWECWEQPRVGYGCQGVAAVLPTGRGRGGARALGALQRGRPALLPLRARRLGGRRRHRPRQLEQVVGGEHQALGFVPAPGHPAVRPAGEWDETKVPLP